MPSRNSTCRLRPPQRAAEQGDVCPRPSRGYPRFLLLPGRRAITLNNQKNTKTKQRSQSTSRLGGGWAVGGRSGMEGTAVNGWSAPIPPCQVLRVRLALGFVCPLCIYIYIYLWSLLGFPSHCPGFGFLRLGLPEGRQPHRVPCTSHDVPCVVFCHFAEKARARGVLSAWAPPGMPGAYH